MMELLEHFQDAAAGDASPVAALLWQAERTPTYPERLAIQEQAITLARRNLGEEALRNPDGRLGALPQARDYLYACRCHIGTLAEAGRRKEAIALGQEILRLDSRDDLTFRYHLAAQLLLLGREEELATLLESFTDVGAFWRYTRALLAFRRHGDTPETQALLAQALEANPHIPDYLLGRKAPGAPGTPHPVRGSEAEARSYLVEFLGCWRDIPGAIDWLRSHDAPSLQARASLPRPRGPLTVQKNWLKKHVPQQDFVWKCHSRQMDSIVVQAGEKVRPWLTLVLDTSRELALGHALEVAKPTSSAVWELLTQAMQSPRTGEPGRPREVHMVQHPRATALREHLEDIGVQLTIVDHLAEMDEVFAGASRRLGGTPTVGKLETTKLRPDQLSSFYAAAADFFQATPWKQAGQQSLARLEGAGFDRPVFLVVMGQSGWVRGMGLYEDAKQLMGIMAGRPTEKASTGRTIGLTFDEEWGVSLAEVEDIRKHGWRLARKDAYPWIMSLDQKGELCPPSARDVEHTEICLRAMLPLVSGRKDYDATPLAVEVPLSGRKVQVTIRWMTSAEKVDALK